MSITSKHDKEISQKIQMIKDVTFNGVLLALLQMASTDNLNRLKFVFPEATSEALMRYHAPAMCLNMEEWMEAFIGEGEVISDKEKEMIESLFDKAERKVGFLA